MKKVMRNLYKTISASVRWSSIRYTFLSLMLVVVISTILLSINVIGTTYNFTVGDIASGDIKVPFDFRYIIDSKTEVEKQKAAALVPLVVDRDQSILVSRLRSIELFFNHILSTLRDNPPIGTDDRTFQLAALKPSLPKYLVYKDKVLLEVLKHQNSLELKKYINRILVYIYDRGILKETFDDSLDMKNRKVTIRTIQVSEKTVEMSKSLDELMVIDDVKKNLYGVCRSIVPNLTRDQLMAVHSIVASNLRANLSYNIDETKRRIYETTRLVRPVRDLLKKGQIIVKEGDTISAEVLKQIKILNKATSRTNINFIAGLFVLQVAFLLIFGNFVIVYFRNLISDPKTSLVFLSLLLFFVFYTFFVSRVENILDSRLIFALLLPISFVTMLIAILFNVYLSLIFGLFLIFFCHTISNFSFPSLILAFSSAFLGAFVVGDVEKRTEFLEGGLILGGINSIVVIAVSLMAELPVQYIFKNIGLAFGCGLANAILAVGVLPVFENFFGITTKFKLLELSDLNASIFKRMLTHAPGTYNHSLMVANLAEAACKDIGGNALLARVGGYYHDIGKLENAGIFIENKGAEHWTRSLPPLRYARLIISHVSKGAELAKKNKLPESIIDFINEHHGKSIMTFFYHKALENSENSDERKVVEKADFQYPGPKPRSKESAVVMLADSIEAASRSIQEPTEVKLEGMVKKILYNKLNEGDLEYADLTMAELNKIQKSFLRILNGIFHSRIEYPEKDELEKLEKRVLNKDNGN